MLFGEVRVEYIYIILPSFLSMVGVNKHLKNLRPSYVLLAYVWVSLKNAPSFFFSNSQKMPQTMKVVIN